MSKRKSNHDHDDFFLAAKADADEDREVRQAQEAKDLYKKEKKEYDQKKKEYDREVELWKIANENGQIMDPPSESIALVRIVDKFFTDSCLHFPYN